MPNPAPGFAKHPDHTITVEPAAQTVNVEIDGRVIGSTNRALILREANYPPVYYLPLETIPPENLVPSDQTTYCPFKGKAGYLDLLIEGNTHSNAVWYYPEPYDEVAEIENFVALYPNVAKVG